MRHQALGAETPPAAKPLLPLHRPELSEALHRGETKLKLLMTTVSSFGARRTIVVAHQEQERVYRIRSGWCARIRYLKDGRAQVSAILLPGDLFAHQALFLSKLSEDIVSVTPVDLESVAQSDLREAAMEDWEIMHRLAWQLADDDRRAHNWLVAIAQATADEKLALLLLDIRARLILAGLVQRDAAAFPWPLTQQDVAQALGLTAVHVNRTWKRLRELGVAQVHHRQAAVSLQPLAALAHPLLDIFERRSPAYGMAPA